jgi:tetratricopeptide (TPR) repeat protein
MESGPEKLKEILAEALARSNRAARAAYLTKACAGDAALRSQVEALITAYEKKGEAAEKSLVAGPGLIQEGPGTVVGRYKLLQQIGEGGFGVVFMADQIEPVQRKVALKIIKAGMDTREVIARFEAERQALALMDHPNIARVLDAGATESGRPYFVMELVKGIKITDFCDQNDLSTRERLHLFIKVCHAVQHAHQKGVIHRDLKPSNVMVTLHDGAPVPKVIDFGIAKATGPRLTGKTLFTRYEQMIGTPAYMSPEQAAISGLDVDTRTDIYALGVLLYELLAGVTPFDSETLARAAFDEIRRMIRETEPPKPSTRLHTMGDKVIEVAKHRHTDPAALRRSVRGDLDWIVMKALEKDRRRRYEAANDLARDVQRHLEHQPVLAGPPGAFYRTRKFVRRHRVGVALAGSITGALIIGLAVSLIGFAKARRERDRAVEAEMRRSQVAKFLEDMLQGVGPSVALGRDTTLLREILDKTAARVARDLKGQPEVEAELCYTLGEVYWEIGELEKAEKMHRRALALRQAALGNEHPDIARSLQRLGHVLWRRGQLDEAEKLGREAVAMQRKLYGKEHLELAKSLTDLAAVFTWKDKQAEVETLLREALAIQRKLLGNDHLEVANALAELSLVTVAYTDRAPEADAMQREALAIWKKALGEDHPEAAVQSLKFRAWNLRREGKLGEAEMALRELVAAQKKLRGEEHPEVALQLYNLGNVLGRQRKFAEAEVAFREAIARQRKFLGGESGELAQTLHSFGNVLRARGRSAEAEAAHREALAIRRRMLGNENYFTVLSLQELANDLRSQRRLAEAETALREALAMRKQLQGNDHPAAVEAILQLAITLRDGGKLTEAGPLADQLLELRRNLRGLGRKDYPALLDAMVEPLSDLGKLADAEEVARESLAIYRKQGKGEMAANNALCQLAWVLQAQGKLAEARAAYREAFAHFSKELERAPTNAAALYISALLSYAAADTNGCRAVAEKAVALLDQAVSEPDAHYAHWACGLAPHVLTNYSPVLQTARRAVATHTNIADSFLEQLTLGGLLCRAQCYAEAAPQLTNAYQLAQLMDPNVDRPSPAIAACFLAMTHAHLGHTNQARAWFQRAWELDPFAERGWVSRLTLDLLRHEAQTVLQNALGVKVDVPRPVVPRQP